MKSRIAVIGAGNGGSAMAAHLTSLGMEVALCDLFPSYLEGIIADGGITLTMDGQTAKYTPALVTTKIEAAIEGVRLIMVVTPSFTHRMIAQACAHALKDGQVIILNPGRTAGAVDFLSTVRANGCQADITVAEAQTLVYACRKTGPSAVSIYAIKKKVLLGVFPASRTDGVLSLLQPVFPQFVPAKNCLETSFSNIGALFHPTPVLLNIGRIESDPDDFQYYIEGISPSVAVLIHQIDAERQAVAAAYGISVLTAEEWLRETYETSGESLYELLQNNQAYHGIKGPHSIEVRYVTEDVPMSLVPISELGKLAGVPTPNIDAVIRLTSTIYGRDFRAEGRCAKNLGIEGMNAAEVGQYFESGEK